jgi:hypothetical protein
MPAFCFDKYVDILAVAHPFTTVRRKMTRSKIRRKIRRKMTTMTKTTMR